MGPGRGLENASTARRTLAGARISISKVANVPGAVIHGMRGGNPGIDYERSLAPGKNSRAFVPGPKQELGLAFEISTGLNDQGSACR